MRLQSDGHYCELQGPTGRTELQGHEGPENEEGRLINVDQSSELLRRLCGLCIRRPHNLWWELMSASRWLLFLWEVAV